MFSKPFKRLLLIGVTALTLVLAIAPASFAGEDDGGDDTTTTTEQAPAPAPAPAPVQQQSSGGSSSGGSSSSSSDTKVAKGGVQTGLGGMATANDAGTMIPLSIGGALVLLSSVGAGSLAFRRR
jgi:hypothetical protein